MSLDAKSVDRDPFVQFDRWFDDWLRCEPREPNAMTLATADRRGVPSARIVLLKGIDAGGFLFFTNYESAKGRELAANPRAAAAQAERPAQLGGDEEMRGPGFGSFAARPLTKKAGLNRWIWDFRIDGGGPVVVPGKFTVRLSADGWTKTQPLTVLLDPRLAKDGVTLLDLREQFNLLVAVRETSSEARQLVQKLDAALRQAKDEPSKQKLQTLRSKLVTAPGTYPQPMLIDQLSSLSRMAGAADRKVGRSAISYHLALKKQLAELKAELAGLVQE